jgi:tetratricopeptide (TPR) repeat protein
MKLFAAGLALVLGMVALLASPAALAGAQFAGGNQSEQLRQAAQLLRDGKTQEALAAVRRELEANPASIAAGNMLDTIGENAEARTVFQRAIDAAPTPAARAAAQRSMAMSYAFSADCANTVKYEEMVIAYWATREQVEPENAFYQQGEMANEAARVCIDHGDLATADKYYRRGGELGLKEPDPRTHPASLWHFRTAHALARLAARRGDAAEAARQVAEARRMLDSDRNMAEDQERFFPYLTGYVGLYTNDLQTAEKDLTRAVGMPGNSNDPFMHYLLGLTFEKLGRTDQARDIFMKAYDLSRGHNPPAAFVRPTLRKKLGLAATH